MGEAIELTWRNSDDELVVEYCLLVDDDDPITLVGTTEPIGTVGEMAGDSVAFENGEGLIFLKPEQVINIRHLT